jgi:hypothetical protein
MLTDEKLDEINVYPENSQKYLKMPNIGDWSLKFHVCSVFKKELSCISVNIF